MSNFDGLFNVIRTDSTDDLPAYFSGYYFEKLEKATHPDRDYQDPNGIPNRLACEGCQTTLAFSEWSIDSEFSWYSSSSTDESVGLDFCEDCVRDQLEPTSYTNPESLVLSFWTKTRTAEELVTYLRSFAVQDENGEADPNVLRRLDTMLRLSHPEAGSTAVSDSFLQ